MAPFVEKAVFEHLFWLRILGDHAQFILDSLSVKEKTDLQKAARLKRLFDQLLAEAKKVKTDEEAVVLAKEVLRPVAELKAFKLELIRKHLHKEVSIHLPPTFINHMVNELEEYERILSYLSKKETPPVFHELHHHLLWLLDASGHAGAIQDQLDATESRLKARSDAFVKHFNQFYLKAVEFTGYLRANIDRFPALNRMNLDVKLEMEMFQHFLQELLELDISAQVLGTFPVLMADHMFREECYYLMKLAESGDLEAPDCDPTKPSV
ncbi:DUF2935 domain-containing protein [Bacillus chungangensis]|uniref:DUF2935 domain-containing protein n=1 Tax=Bacillus chungangensis TaxID=587633 RepID=A0ABT9WZF0_9BACI|nr:DUF2935 domain-containing protein [Bacillus chungangensis]MDQ0178561.1 hypothetical protein [Bacillus chungangensis]